MARGQLLRELGGFDERFFHQFEDADLCRRIWDSGHPVIFFPGAEITHIGGQNRGTYSTKVNLETERSKYKYFYKYYGLKGAVLTRYFLFSASDCAIWPADWQAALEGIKPLKSRRKSWARC